jgi:hypothetical protein
VENHEGGAEPLQALETGWAAESESALLRDFLTRSKKQAPRGCRARLHAYKHRLHALRCDYANARLRVLDLEEQLAHSQLVIQQMRSTRAWRMRERYHCWRQTLSQWFRRLRSPGAGRTNERLASPADEVRGSCPVP